MKNDQSSSKCAAIDELNLTGQNCKQSLPFVCERGKLIDYGINEYGVHSIMLTALHIQSN